MSRSIADVYACRKDWFDANRETVEKLFAGYLKGCDETVLMRREFEESRKMSPQYRKILEMTQPILGPELFKSLEDDVHGLFMDSTAPISSV